MSAPDTVYVSYIGATPESVWRALTDPSVNAGFYFGRTMASDWREGSPWSMSQSGQEPEAWGRVLESDPPRSLRLSWEVRWPDDAPEKPVSYISFQIEHAGDGVVRLTMTESHPELQDLSLLDGGRRGWPAILSNLKTYLETGEPLPPFSLT